MSPDASHSRADRLRDYYGIGAPAAQPADTQGTAQSADTPAPTPSLAEIASTKPLGELVRLATSVIDSAYMLTDVRELHADRQSLVYNHHQELVAAAETVGQMRSGIDELNKTSDALGAHFTAIDELRRTLSVLPERDQACAEWSAVYPVIALPATLGTLADQQKQTELESTWSTYQPVLESWLASGVAGAAELLDSCRAVVGAAA